MSSPGDEQTGPAGALSAGGQRRVLAILCVTEVTSWGVLYYAFPVLAPTIAKNTGWSISTVTAAFSWALVVAAVVGMPVGRRLDQTGPRKLMTAGSVLAVPAVVGIAMAQSLPVFFLAWTLAGVAMSGVLYPPAFAALTRWWGGRRVTALTALTLIAGLASTVFAPLTAALLEHLGWRATYVVLAAILALITIPAHFFGLRGRWPASESTEHTARSPYDPRSVTLSRPFVLLVVAMSLGAFTAFAVIVNQVPLLIERGLSTTTAAWALGLGGVGQVLGRLGYGRLDRVTGVTSRTMLILGFTSITTAVLAALPGPAPLLIAAAMLAGAGRGIFTLLQATAVTDRWGAEHYGRLNGLLSAPAMLATALAPWAGAAVAEALGGYPALFWILAAIAGSAAVLSYGAASERPRPLSGPGPGRAVARGLYLRQRQ